MRLMDVHPVRDNISNELPVAPASVELVLRPRTVVGAIGSFSSRPRTVKSARENVVGDGHIWLKTAARPADSEKASIENGVVFHRRANNEGVVCNRDVVECIGERRVNAGRHLVILIGASIATAVGDVFGNVIVNRIVAACLCVSAVAILPIGDLEYLAASNETVISKGNVTDLTVRTEVLVSLRLIFRCPAL